MKSVLKTLVNELLILKEIQFPYRMNENAMTTGTLPQKCPENGEGLGL
jgi:hypothetical protein